MAPPSNPALDRLLSEPDNQVAFDALSERLSGTELTSMLLGVFARRAASVTPAGVLRQYRQDRFVSPAAIDALELAQLELALLQKVAAGFEVLRLAPVAPFGTHCALGDTPQNNVVSTARLTEVTADPTSSLALEAAVRRGELLRQASRSTQQVKLGAVHRVTRAQHFDGPRSFAHFSLLGLVTAARDQGDHRFELAALRDHLESLVIAVRAVTTHPLVIRLTPSNPQLRDALTQMAAQLSEQLHAHDVHVSVWLEREHGRGYYRNVCFKLFVNAPDEALEIGDGGDVGWTQDLLQNRKERLMTSGIGVDRLAMAAATG